MKKISAPNCLKWLINTKKHMCLFPLKEYPVILILIPASRTRGPEKDNNVLELFFIVWYQTTVISINVTIFCNYVLRSLQIPSVTSRISGGYPLSGPRVLEAGQKKSWSNYRLYFKLPSKRNCRAKSNCSAKVLTTLQRGV